MTEKNKKDIRKDTKDQTKTTAQKPTELKETDLDKVAGGGALTFGREK